MKIKISKPLASDSPANEDDVYVVKQALNRLGYYQPSKKIGITEIPDQQMFEALQNFQEEEKIRLSATIKPEDETVSALNRVLTEQEKEDIEYTWVTVGDDKVRKSHAALEGQRRLASEGVNPGDEYGCRCWMENVKQVNQSICMQESIEHAHLKRHLKELSVRFNDVLLRLDDLIEKNNELVEKTQKNLGVRVVAYILTLPFDRLGVLGELLQRYFGGVISDVQVDAAEEFMKELEITRQRIWYTKDQKDIIWQELRSTELLLQQATKRLENCENSEE